ncbi:hypothetical protein BCO_0127200 (plasmid) [Borrelia coriaceae ATCC 43381]|uniref:Variable large protein n=1 Tax=Borrelia coriaceae ATCC 43381 TaxID=1408429 RepID=W5SWH7_9SPIR|nr:hypothetical protein BCO_0127200 [Borrelia coriaceae ATCC 43381]
MHYKQWLRVVNLLIVVMVMPIAKEAIKNLTVSAVTKTLGTLTVAIRKIIDAGLKEIKKAMEYKR